jgi:D-alanyl-D-alanine carboxypeptidase
MRLRAGIIWLTAAATMIGGVAACSAADAGQGSRPASGQAAAAAARTRAPAMRSGPRPPAGPVIEVTGAPAGVKAKGAVLAEAASGQVLWSRDAGTERPMASVTKVMTALLVLQSGSLGREIRVPQAAVSYAWKYGGETASLRPGDVLTVQELLEALLLPSGADAAYTLADAYGPGL